MWCSWDETAKYITRFFFLFKLFLSCSWLNLYLISHNISINFFFFKCVCSLAFIRLLLCYFNSSFGYWIPHKILIDVGWWCIFSTDRCVYVIFKLIEQNDSSCRFLKCCYESHIHILYLKNWLKTKQTRKHYTQYIQ